MSDIVAKVDEAEQYAVEKAKAAKAEFEKFLGKEAADKILLAAEDFLKTDAGLVIQTATQAAKTALPNGAGATLKAVAAAFSTEAFKQLGVTVEKQFLNLTIELVLAKLAL